MKVTERYKLPDRTATDLSDGYNSAFGFNGFGEATFYRTYSRYSEPLGRQETWLDTCIRVVEGTLSVRKHWYVVTNQKWDAQKWERIGLELLVYMYQMKVLPPGRGLWAMGSEHVFNVGSMALCNCAATVLTATTMAEDFSWAMDALMCGCGVGFKLPESGNVHQFSSILRRPIPASWTYTIPDTREGWVESLRLLITSYMITAKDNRTVLFNYKEIRQFGEPIQGFGGIASGPASLIILHLRVRAYLELFLDHEIGVTRFLADIANAIGVCVVSGNVRRGAEILLGSPSDSEFLNLKRQEGTKEEQEALLGQLAKIEMLAKGGKASNYKEALSYIDSIKLKPAHFLIDRATIGGFSLIGGLSNNSCRLVSSSDFLELPPIIERIKEAGEPGLLNILNIQKYGRYGEKQLDEADNCNPCGEIPLEDKELCNLVEIFPTRCQNFGEFYKACQLGAFYAQTVSLLSTHRPETNTVIARNRRIGVSITGVADWLDLHGAIKVTNILRTAYQLVRTTADQYAKESGVPNPVRVTTVKPSGTVSQLPGVSSGMHFPTFQYAIRRMRVAKDSVIDNVLRRAHIPFEADVTGTSANVFEFPINQGSTRPATTVSAWEQFSFLAMLQREWSDNMVSCTIYFDPKTEGDQLEYMIGQFLPIIKSVSLLPHTPTGAYPQMPYEGITKEEYEKRSAAIRQIEWSHEFERTELEQDRSSILYCDNDSCEL